MEQIACSDPAHQNVHKMRRNQGFNSTNTADCLAQNNNRNTAFGANYLCWTKSKSSMFTHLVCVCFLTSANEAYIMLKGQDPRSERGKS